MKRIQLILILSFFAFMSGFTQDIMKRSFENASAQKNILLHEKYMQESTNFEYPNFETHNLPTPKKAKSAGQDWWEPDTTYTFAKEIIFNVSEIKRKITKYEYNSQGLLEVDTELFQSLHNDLWENGRLCTYTYDLINNKITYIEKIWQNNSWVNTQQTTYTYDLNNNLLTVSSQGWKSNNWENLWSYTYTYDSNNNILTYLYENNIRNIQETYTYDSNNHKLTSLRHEQNYSMLNITQTTYTYDSNNNMITCLSKVWNNNSWEDSSLITYIYDSNNNLLTELFQRPENSSWKNSQLDIYTYDSNNNMLTHLIQESASNLWINLHLFTYTYDSNNNMTNQLWQRGYSSSNIENYKEHRMIYDENNNGISAEFYFWIDESWQTLFYSVISSDPLRQNFYYNNMQSVIQASGCYKATASYIKVSDFSGKEEIKTSQPIQIYSAGKTIHINNSNGKNGVVSVYRIDGVKVTEQTIGSQTTTLEIPVSGFYLVSVRAGNEKPVMTKVIIR